MPLKKFLSQEPSLSGSRFCSLARDSTVIDPIQFTFKYRRQYKNKKRLLNEFNRSYVTELKPKCIKQII